MNRNVSPTILIFLLLLFFMAVIYYVGTTSVGLGLSKAAQQIIYAVSGRTANGTAAGYPNVPTGAQPNAVNVAF